MLSLRHLVPAALLVTALAGLGSSALAAAPRASAAAPTVTKSYGIVEVRQPTGPGRSNISGQRWDSTFKGTERIAPRKGVKLEEHVRLYRGGKFAQRNHTVEYTNGWRTTNATLQGGNKLHITSRGGRSTTRAYDKGGTLIDTWKSGRP